MGRTLGLAALAALLFCGAACGGSDGSEDVGDDSENALGAGTVGAAANAACSTAVVRGLTDQLLAEITCLSPDALGPIDSIANVELEPETLPVMQKAAIPSLTKAAADVGGLKISSALRTLPQQYLLHRWAARRRCGITAAAPVGQSNHEQGLAVDVLNPATRTLRTKMANHDFHWLGSFDAVHYDWVGPDTVDLEGLSTRAFKRLWNRNHPEAKLEENETYDAKTEAKLVLAPSVGFPIGAQCDR